MALTPNCALNHVLDATGIPLKTFAEATGVKAAVVLDWKIGMNSSIRFKDKEIKKFANFFGVDDASILNGTPDIELIRKRFLGPVTSLPGRYEESPNSFLRSSFYIMEYLNLLLGKEMSDRVLISLDVHPLSYGDLSQKVNIRLVVDLLKKCIELGFSKKHFELLAGSMFLSLDKISLENLTEIDSHREFFKRFREINYMFDRNFDYDYQIGIKSLVIKNEPISYVKRLARTNIREFTLLEWYRGLLYSHSPRLAGLPAIPLIQTSSLSSGHSILSFQMRSLDEANSLPV